MLIAHGRHLRHALALVALVLVLDDLFHLHDIPAPVEIGHALRRQILAQLRARGRVGKSLLAHLHRQEHEILPVGELIENLGVLQVEVTDQGNRLGQAVGTVAVTENPRHRVQLLLPQRRLGPAMVHALPDDRPLRPAGQVVVGVEVLHLVAAEDGLDDAAVELAEHVAQSVQLIVVREPAGHGLAVFPHVPLVAVGGETQGAGIHGVPHQALHLVHFARGGRSLHRLLAHDVLAHGDVAHQAAGVDAESSLQRVEILAVGVPAPGHSLFQGGAGNRLHPHEALDQGVLAAVVHGRKGQAAVPHDHGSDAVLWLGGAVGVPKDLCIHVGVVIDESRSHHQAGGVDGPARRSLETAYLGDLAILHPDVRRVGRQSGTVGNAAATYQQIIFHSPVLLGLNARILTG